MLSQARKKLQADAMGGVIKDVADIKQNYTTRDEVQKNYATKVDLVSNYPSKTEVAANYPTKREVATNYTTKKEIQAANFATKGDLAAYQPKGNYATREEIQSANYALKTDLAGYQPKGNYQPAGDYAIKADLAAYQPKGDYATKKEIQAANYATKGDLSTYALKADLAAFQPKGDYALKSELAGLNPKVDLSGYQPKGDYAVKADLAAFQPKGDYALKSDLASVNPKVDLSGYQPKGDYALKSDLATFQPKGDYAIKGDLAAYQPKGDYAVKTDLAGYAAKSDLAAYALKSEISKQSGSGNGVFAKPDGFDKPAVQIGETNDAKDTNIYSLSFGKAEGGTYAGMGLVPNDKKAFTDTKGYVLGTHVKADSELGVFSDGWDKLFAVQGGSGNTRVKGSLNVGGSVNVASGQPITIRDQYHGIQFAEDVDGPSVYGYGGGKLRTAGNARGETAKDSLLWNRDGVKVPGNLEVGGNVTVGGKPINSGSATGPLKISDRWVLQDEGGVAVLRDVTETAKGKDSRFAFFGSKYVDVDNQAAAAAAAEKQTISDTRDVNLSPEQYYEKGRGTYREFKASKSIGVPSEAVWCHLETIVNWNDPSGGPIYQYAHCSATERYVRISEGTGAWKREEWKNAKWGNWSNTSLSDYDAFSNGGDAQFSEGWNVEKNNAGWDVVVRGAASRTGLAYTNELDDQNATARTATIPVPAGMRSGFLFHLPWSNCRHFDVWGVLADGQEVFINRVNAYHNVRNAAVANLHDGIAIVPIPRVDRFANIRIKGVRGRVHYMGMGWSRQLVASGNNTGFVGNENIIFPIISRNDGFRHLIQNTNNAGQLRHTLEADQNALTVATFDNAGNWNGRHPVRIQRESGHVENYNDNKNSYSLNAWGVKDGGWGVIFKNGPDRDADGGKKTFTVRNDDGDLRLQSNGGVVKINNNLSINDDGNGLTIKAIGGAGKDRMHVMSEDELYILNKKGVIIGKDWGGSGNLTVQGDASVGGQAYVGDNVIMTGDNSWILHTPNDGRKQMYVAPGTNGANWDWGRQTQFMADGTIVSSGGIDKQTISDTRDENLTPEQYYAKGRGTYREFKSKKALGVPSDVDWCHLETIVNWGDASGGPIYQYAHCSDTERYVRTSNVNKWNAWRLTTFSDYDAFSNGGDAEFSAGWDIQKGNNAWDVGIRGGSGYTGLAYTDRENDQSATDRTATIPVPAGMRSGFLFHLPWSNCRHFDIFGVLANGREAFITRVNAYQGVKHENVDGYHDGAAIVPIPRVDRFAKIRLKGVKGRIHYMGTGWSRQIIASGNNGTGFISSENVIGTVFPGDVKGDLNVSGKIKFAEDTDWANIGVEGGANRKDLTIRWADDDDDKLRFVFKHHAREDKEVANMTKDGMNVNGQLVIAPEGLKVSNPNDWQRIFGSDNYGVALYNGLSVNDNGGVMVGAWQRPPQGMILSKYSMHSFTDAGGNDIGGASLDNGTLAECKAKCDSLNECKSFNFRTDRSLTDPNARGPCWIKNSASNNRAPTADWHLFTKNF